VPIAITFHLVPSNILTWVMRPLVETVAVTGFSRRLNSRSMSSLAWMILCPHCYS
jgi:hypothetical protein